MGKKKGNMLLTDSGKKTRVLNPTDAYRKRLKQKELKRNKDDRKNTRVLAAVRKDPQKAWKDLEELDRLDRQGKLDRRLKDKKKELRATLLEHFPKKSSEASKFKVEMLNAYGKEMEIEEAAAPPPPADDSDDSDEDDDMENPPIPPPPGAPIPPPPGLPPPGAMPPPVNDIPPPPGPPPTVHHEEDEIISAAPEVDHSLLKPKKQPVQRNPGLMLSMVPASVMKRRTQAAVEERERTHTIIPGSHVTTKDLAQTLGPAPLVQPSRRITTMTTALPTTTTINLAPDVDEEALETGDAEEEEDQGPLLSSSLFFNPQRRQAVAAVATRRPAPAPVKRPAPAAPPSSAPPAKKQDEGLDAELASFLSDVSGINVSSV